MNLNGLSQDKHKNLKMHRAASFGFTEKWHSLTLATGEMAKAALHYPLLFVRTDAGFHPVALLSLVQNENQYLDGDTWRATYVPAALRVYPFRLAGEQVLIDESAPHFSNKDGEVLFTEKGEPTPILADALNFLRTCHAAEEQTQAWCKHLDELSLLVDRSVDVVSPQGARYRLEGFYVVDTIKIGLLPDTVLTVLVRDGSLALIHAHLLSLEHLVTLAAWRDGHAISEAAATEAPEPVQSKKTGAPDEKRINKKSAEMNS